MRKLFGILLFCSVTATMSAQATRTWVSGVGDDANPCSRTAPCKTYAGAISKTATGGEISTLDPGGFGAVTITKSITINGNDEYGSILFTGTNGIVISLPSPADAGGNTVILRGLELNGAGSGLSGIRILGGVANVHLEDIQIERSARGVEVVSTGAGLRLHMKDINIRRTSSHGIDINPSSGAFVTLSLNDVRASQAAGAGLKLQRSVGGTVAHSFFQSNGTGIAVDTSSAGVSIADTVISDNTGTGLENGIGSTTVINGVSVFGNNTGILNNGSIFGFGNNAIAYNMTDQSGNAIMTLPHP